MIANVSLCLLGLERNSGKRKEDIWKEAKRSYNVRSDLVHAFKIPEAKELAEAKRFAEKQCKYLLKHAIGRMNDGCKNKNDLIEELRSRAFE